MVSIAARRSQMCSVTHIDTIMCAKATFITADYSLGKPQKLSEASASAATHQHVLKALTATSCPAASTALHSSTCFGATGQNMKTRFPASPCTEDTQLALPHSQQVQLQRTGLQHWTDSQTHLTEQHTAQLAAVTCSLYQFLSHSCAAAGTITAVLPKTASEV